MSSGLLKPPSSRHKCRINPDMPKVLTWPLISVASWCKFVLLHLLKYPIYKQWWYHYVALLWLHSDIRLIKPFCAESDPSFFFLNCGFLIVPCTFALFSDMSWVVKGVWNSPQYLKQTFFYVHSPKNHECNTLFWGLSNLPYTSNGSREFWLTCTHCPSSPTISLLKDFYEPVLLLSFAQFMDPTPLTSDKPWYYSNGRHNLHFKINTVNLEKCQSKQKAQCPALCRSHCYAKLHLKNLTI